MPDFPRIVDPKILQEILARIDVNLSTRASEETLGMLVKILEEGGFIATLSYPDHTFIPEQTITDTGVTLQIKGLLYSIRVHPNSAPVKVNFDRPVTDTEYTVVFPGVIKKIGRITSTLYMKAPQGQTSKVDIEVLKSLDWDTSI